MLLAAGAEGPPPHRHVGQRETFEVISGCLVVTLDGVDHQLGPGESVVVPSGGVHTFRNDREDESARCRITMEPALRFQWALREMAKSAIRRGGSWQDLLIARTRMDSPPGPRRVLCPPRDSSSAPSFVEGRPCSHRPDHRPASPDRTSAAGEARFSPDPRLTRRRWRKATLHSRRHYLPGRQLTRTCGTKINEPETNSPRLSYSTSGQRSCCQSAWPIPGCTFSRKRDPMSNA
jgi:hypothetical protein